MIKFLKSKVLVFGVLCIALLMMPGCSSPFNQGSENQVSEVVEPAQSSASVVSAAVSYPAWTPDQVYTNGHRVSHKGENWEAKWWTIGEEPGTTGQWGVWKKVSPDNPVVKVTLTADKQTVNKGDNVTLSWSSQNAVSVTASGGWSGSKSLSGSEVVRNIQADTSFTLTAVDAAGKSTFSTVTVKIAAAQPLQLTLTTDKLTVNKGGEVTLSWSSQNAVSVTASGGWSGSKAFSGFEVIRNIQANTSFSLTAVDAAGLQKVETVSVTVSTGPEPVKDILDGPYVFYRNGQVVVKYITKTGAVTRTYSSAAQADLTCVLPNNLGSFKVSLESSHPVEKAVYTQPAAFFATSDIEGDIGAFVMLLKGAGIMNSSFNWTFGNGHLFISGDMVDRGANVTECLWLLYRLESQAEAQGGKIHWVLGNHDVMKVRGDYRYVNSKYSANMSTIGETLDSYFSQDSEFGRWIRSKNIVEKAGKFIFCHGGISPDVERLNLSFEKMNYYGRHHLDYSCADTNCSIVNGGSTQGIYWYRGMTKKLVTQSQVDSIMRTFSADHIVVGHTIFSDITPLYNSKVLAIDLDHSSNYYYGYMKALAYKNNTLYNFRTNGSTGSYTVLR